MKKTTMKQAADYVQQKYGESLRIAAAASPEAEGATRVLRYALVECVMKAAHAENMLLVAVELMRGSLDAIEKFVTQPEEES